MFYMRARDMDVDTYVRDLVCPVRHRNGAPLIGAVSSHGRYRKLTRN